MTARPESATVAHILPFPAVGGTEVATRRIAHAAAEYGIESIAFVQPHAEPVRELFAADGIEVAEYKAVAPSYRSPGAFIANSVRLAREFRRRGVRLVHCSDILGAMFAGHAARLAGLPVICHVRNRYSDISRRDRSFLWPVQKFVFVSQDTWRHFAADVGESRGEVLYDGIELPGFDHEKTERAAIRAEFGISGDAPVIGMVARVAAQKDYPTLVAAAEKVVHRHPGARFLIVGDCSATETVRRHHAEVMERVRASGLEAHFIFTDFRRDVPRFFHAMDVFALSTHWEGLPLVILEAMAYAKPVVATNVDGMPEVVADGITGHLVPHANADALAARLTDLLDNRAVAQGMGERGRGRVASEFSRDAFSSAVGSLYSRMLGMATTENRGTAQVSGIPENTAGAVVTR